MNYGHFDDARCEYVITRPDTPYPWINYLGSEDFFSLMSNTSGGYTFYKDARLLRMTRYRYNNVPRKGTSSGTPAGSPPRRRWTATNAAWARATPASPLPKTA